MVDGLTYAWHPLGFAYFSSALLLLAAGVAIAGYARLARASRRLLVVTVLTAGLLAVLGMALLAGSPQTELFWLRLAWVVDPFTAVALLWLIRDVAAVQRRAVLPVALILAVAFAALNVATPWLVEGLQSATREHTLTGYGWLGALYFGFVTWMLGSAVVELGLSRARSVTLRDRLERTGLFAAAAAGSLTLLDYWLPAPAYRAGWVTPVALVVAAVVVVWVGIRYRVFSLTRSFGTGEVLEAMSDVVLMLDDEGRVRGLNRAAQSLLGVKRESLLGQPASAFLQEGHGTPWLPAPGQTLRDRELWAVPRSGHRIPLSVATEPLIGAGRRRGTVLVARDISDRVAAAEAVQLQRRYFEDLFDNIPEAIVMVDEADRVIRANAEFVRLFGYTEEEAVGREVEELIVPEDLHSEGRQLARTVAGGRDIMEETVRRRKDGTLVDVSVLARRLDVPGEPLQLYAIYRDISDRKAAESQLRERDQELRHAQKMEAVGTLAGGIAHDFNNLMTVITGHIRFALENLSDTEQVRRDLEEVDQAGGRAAKLTQQLLAFSRRQVLRPRPLDVNEVIQDTERLLSRTIGEHIQIETRPYTRPCTVWADRGQLEQVLVNLAINARDAMPEGGTVTVSAEAITLAAGSVAVTAGDMRPGPAVRITVADTGVGMDEDTQELIFDPFFTTKARDKGTGLGLSTVFGIVKQSDGHVTVDSTPGEGTRFDVFLPRVGPGFEPELAELPESPESQAAPPDASPDGPAPGRTVMVVEDEAGVRALAVRVLERAGHTVLSAANGVEALAALDGSGPVDLLLTDLVMPEMGGRELAAELRRRWSTLRVLFMSGYDDWQGTVADADGHFLSKPFTPDDLARRVADLLAVRD